MRRPRETGQVTVQVILMVPIIVMMMYSAFMAGFAWYARNAMQIAASDALSLSQTQASGMGSGGDPATVATDLIKTLKVSVSDVKATSTPVPGIAGFVTWSVSGVVPGPFPGSSMTVEGHASGPLDGFRPQSDVK